ncbi:helix-turn-helix domain-containing protein [Mycobacteroides abscessus]|uniref:helix-turn-helix domain-containing protein n=1 Tax=Mycobacteroides abscessus TaxID=36809 RepID=UPI0011C49F99|nr:helix-turn-helix domain-containing protein [Mycobacteroides abscessus]
MSTDWRVQIGQGVRRAREARNMKWATVADRTKELGAPIHRVALKQLEEGQRDVSVPELVGIAAALRVSPLRLLFPNVLEDVEPLPGMEMPGTDALDWFTGQGPGPDSDHLGVLGFGDDAMRFASRIAEIDRGLASARRNLALSERALELKTSQEALDVENAAHYKRQIKLLELERKNRISEYKGLAGIWSPQEQLQLVRERLEKIGHEHKDSPQLREAIAELENRVAENG